MKVAVTSASGALGGAIIKELKAQIGADSIIGLARTPSKAEHLGVEIRPGDYNDPDALDASMRGVDRVVLLSGNDEPHKRIKQHRNVIEAAKANGATRMVYTSIVGAGEGNSFSPIVNSNRQTEMDVQESGMDWVIGRNNIYIEPDLDYWDHYLEAGEIANCAGEGRCGYTSRPELAVAYAKMVLDEHHSKQVYTLAGTPITQTELAEYMSKAFGETIVFRNMTEQDYLWQRKAELGEFLGTVIAGIYAGIGSGNYDVPSHFEVAAGRSHASVTEMIDRFKTDNGL